MAGKVAGLLKGSLSIWTGCRLVLRTFFVTLTRSSASHDRARDADAASRILRGDVCRGVCCRLRANAVLYLAIQVSLLCSPSFQHHHRAIHRLRKISLVGVGVLVGAALIIIIPEGIHMFLAAQAHADSTSAEEVHHHEEEEGAPHGHEHGAAEVIIICHV